MKNQLILYDFCGTLVDFQTANAYARFTIKSLGKKRRIVEFVRLILNKLRLISLLNIFRAKMSVNKSLLLYQLKGCKYEEMDSCARRFYKECITPHLITPVLKRLQQDIENGNTVAIVSGGYDIYLKYFAEEYNVPFLICTQLKFIDNLFTGSIVGKDCMEYEKINRLHSVFPCLKSEDNFFMTLYSDSLSDIPLFNECERRIAVIEEDNVPEWVNRIGAEVINYNKHNQHEPHK